MLTGIHFILSYTCNFECDHCFLHCSPRAKGTFTLDQVTRVLDDARKMGSMEWIFYEGGEPFLFYPLLNEGVRLASERGFKVGIVTNAYGATTPADAQLWLKPLADSGLSYLSVSNDAFHYGDEAATAVAAAVATAADTPAAIAHAAAKALGIDTSSIAIEPPRVEEQEMDAEGKGKPVIGGGAKFRGRAVDTLTAGLPLRPWRELGECPYEDLATPSRVHVDAFGHVHLCQGISMGNLWETPLSELMANYRPDAHPICGPLLEGGPAALAGSLGVTPAEGYVDECHFCYLCRRAALDRFAPHLGPRQVYGFE
jgi:MoaA/NifB/PqqE/SkfB family radical SAM enzyme